MFENGGSKLVKSSSVLLSILFHPLFVPVYALLIMFNSPTFLYYLPGASKRVILLLAIVNMTIVPLALMPFLRYRNVISSYNIESRVERVIPLTIGSMMYLITTFIFYSYQNIPVVIKSFMTGASIVSFLMLVITFRWKISIHAAGMGALLGTVMGMSVTRNANLIAYWLPLIIFSGMVLSARMKMGSHNPAQIYSGFILGFVTLLVTLVLI